MTKLGAQLVRGREPGGRFVLNQHGLSESGVRSFESRVWLGHPEQS